jgi:hypothetical protein
MQTPLDRRSFLCCAVTLCIGFVVPRRVLAAQDEAAAKLLGAPIERRAVTSTSIAGIGYHARLQVLEIAFRSGAVYRYVAVPPAVFEALMKAESKGRYFTQYIRNRFAFHRMEDIRP